MFTKRTARTAGKKTAARGGAASLPARTSEQRAEIEAGRKMARRLLNRPKHQRELEKRLDDMSIHPSVLTALMYFAYGRPTEYQEITQPVPVRVEHVYATSKKPPRE